MKSSIFFAVVIAAVLFSGYAGAAEPLQRTTSLFQSLKDKVQNTGRAVSYACYGSKQLNTTTTWMLLGNVVKKSESVAEMCVPGSFCVAPVTFSSPDAANEPYPVPPSGHAECVKADEVLASTECSGPNKKKIRFLAFGYEYQTDELCQGNDLCFKGECYSPEQVNCIDTDLIGSSGHVRSVGEQAFFSGKVTRNGSEVTLDSCKSSMHLVEARCEAGNVKLAGFKCSTLLPTSTCVVDNGQGKCTGYDELPDTDGDGVKDPFDNCVDVANSNQTDSDNNGIGDECDSIVFSRIYNGEYMDTINSAAMQTADGGYAFAGTTQLPQELGVMRKAWFVRLNYKGDIVWQKAFADEPNEQGLQGQTWASSISQTIDGGFVALLVHESFVPSGTSNKLILYKLSADGTIIWQKKYDSSDDDSVATVSIEPTGVDGFILAYSNSSDGDLVLMRLDPSGNIIWQKKYPSLGFQRINKVIDVDGGYVVASVSTYLGVGMKEACLLKVDTQGEAIWQKSYGGFKDDEVNFIQQTADGGYIFVGSSDSFGEGSDVLKGNTNAWVVRLDTNGDIVWEKIYGSAYDDYAVSIQPSLDGGYFVTGSKSQTGYSTERVWLFKLNENGNIEWQKTYSDSLWMLVPATRTSDDGIIIGAHNMENVWLLKLGKAGSSAPNCTITNGNESFAVSADTSAVVKTNPVTIIDENVLAEECNLQEADTTAASVEMCL